MRCSDNAIASQHSVVMESEFNLGQQLMRKIASAETCGIVGRAELRHVIYPASLLGFVHCNPPLQ